MISAYNKKKLNQNNQPIKYPNDFDLVQLNNNKNKHDMMTR